MGQHHKLYRRQAVMLLHFAIAAPYRMMFSPQRLSSIFSLQFVKENLNVVDAFLKSKLQKSTTAYPHMRIAIELDDHRYGVYQDENDELYIVDILCPHLGCTLRFNADEKTWDCPCHGSRFSYTGEIIRSCTQGCIPCMSPIIH